jgi:hypothetical protein
MIRSIIYAKVNGIWCLVFGGLCKSKGTRDCVTVIFMCEANRNGEKPNLNYDPLHYLCKG